uniref:Uncharacterized protein n=2 Tax=Cycas TaxID=3395 RepID=A0A1D8BEU1_CYCPA|nr:hypothetical_protein [Cycas revoluta]YP_009308177.1 hypothetical protein [Cycas panzhihuaensis]AEX99157.1 hypothetical_protein [Cycas revoluta]AOS53126.1 hypothetical protein [Cycas panzhihuaensis]
MYIILFTHFKLSIRFLPFSCYDWKSRILHICTIKSLGSQKSVVSNHCYLTRTCSKKVEVF